MALSKKKTLKDNFQHLQDLTVQSRHQYQQISSGCRGREGEGERHVGRERGEERHRGHRWCDRCLSYPQLGHPLFECKTMIHIMVGITILP